MNNRRAPRAVERRVSKEKWEGAVLLTIFGDSFAAV